MDIIFLDVDGVLNSTRSLIHANKAELTKSERDFLSELSNTYYNGYPLSVLSRDLLGLNRRCIKNLNKIIDATGAKVVVSSSWRFTHSLQGLQKLLEYLGFKGELIDITPMKIVGPTMNRGREIQAWLDMHLEATRFVIIDDDKDMEPLMQYLVQVNHKVGLTEANATKAISIIDSFGI